MIAEFFNEILDYFQKGGFVMPPLAIGTLILWYAMGYRFSTLNRGNRRSARILLEKYRRGYERKPSGIIDIAVITAINAVRANPLAEDVRGMLDDAFEWIEIDCNRGKSIITSIVAVAPLAGLLGTVVGMIETFDSLGDMELFSQSGGIAGGISQALFTTQMGLVVAVPGVVLGRILDRKQIQLEDELEQIKQTVSAEAERFRRAPSR